MRNIGAPPIIKLTMRKITVLYMPNLLTIVAIKLNIMVAPATPLKYIRSCSPTFIILFDFLS